MSNEPEQKTVDPSALSSNQEKKSPVSMEERLLNLNAEESKKALHDSRTLKQLGILSYILAVCALLLFVFFLVLPRLPGYNDLGHAMHREIKEWKIILLLLIVILPAYGFALRKWRTNAAKWLFRITAILAIIGGVLDMTAAVRESNWGEFIGKLVSVLISVRLCVITFNNVLFSANPPSHNQLGYVRSKWKAGEKPDRIPEHVHKLPKYAKTCFILALLMIPMSLLLTLRSFSRQMTYANAQEYYEAGQTAFNYALQATTPQQRNEKFSLAYYNFVLASSDPNNKDVHVDLGLCAARGLGCKKDEDEAFRQLTMYPEATSSNPNAQYELALLYLYGRGTNRDIKKAAELLQAAARNRQREAMEFLGYKMIEMNGDNLEENVEIMPDYGGKTVEEYLEEKVRNDSLVKTENSAAADAPAQQ